MEIDFQIGHCTVIQRGSRSKQPKTWIDNMQENLLENNLDWRAAVKLVSAVRNEKISCNLIGS